jgi:catechol 2,3-dioxygenase-like lactoylglutathione lyase family enzyme
MLRTPDGRSRLELARFHTPAISAEPEDAPANTLGIRRITFAVEDIEDIEDVVARLQAHGAGASGAPSSTHRVARLSRIAITRSIDVELAVGIYATATRFSWTVRGACL